MSDGISLTCDGDDQFSSQTTCIPCSGPSEYKYGTNGETTCHSTVTNPYIQKKNDAEVECASGLTGTPSYDAQGKYSSGCDVSGAKPYIYGVIEAKNTNGNCVKQCARWSDELLNGFNTTTAKKNIDLALYGEGTAYCTYLLWTQYPIKSSDC